MRHRLHALLMLLALPLALHAQLLPPLPPLPAPAPLPPVLPPLREAVRDAAQGGAQLLQPLAAQARALLRAHPAALEADPRGMPIVRAVIVALSPDPDALARAVADGYVVQDDRQLEGLDERLVTLLVPAGAGTREALRDLRRGDPQGRYDFDHLYVESAVPAPWVPSSAAPLPAAAPAASAAAPAASAATFVGPMQPVNVRVGLIDGGVDGTHVVFQRRPPRLSGCAGASHPSVHGTAVASLFVGWSDAFRGAAPGAELLAVDVYCGSSAPGGRMRDVVAGLGELSSAQARVINMSIVGPDNAVLAAAVRAVQARAVLIVAATGNDGPHAKPLYPAAYPDVIAVSAVDEQLRVLPEASGGAHVSFAAPGADLLAAVPDGRFEPVRGTSFAAPLVAGMLARELAQHNADRAEIVRRIAAHAQDRGRKGRDERYGYGLVGADLPVRGLMAAPAR